MRILLMLPMILFLSQQATAGEAQQQGRYQIVFSPHLRADTFLLDTWTGKTWNSVKMVDAADEPSVWMYRDRIDSLKEQFEWQKKNPKPNDLAP